MAPKEFSSFSAFYPYYLGEHQNSTCRRLHFVGSAGVLSLLCFALITSQWHWLYGLPLLGYGFAWLGHFVFEKNKPATFRYPLYSLMGDWVMFKDMLVGKVKF